MSRDIPPKIIALILDSLADLDEDNGPKQGQFGRSACDDLTTCSRVSPLWDTIANVILCRVITLGLPYGESANGARTTAWTAFLEFLRQCPRVRKGIDTLEITPPLGATEDDSTTASEVDMHSLSGLVGMLPNLAHLELTAVKLLASEAPPPLFSTLYSFDYDAYRDGSRYTMDEFFNLILPPLAGVCSIRFSNSSFSHQRSFVLRGRPHFEQLSALNMRDNDGMGAVIKNLTQLVHDGCLQSLSEVSFGTLVPRDISGLNRFLFALGGILKEVTLELDYKSHNVSRYPRIQLEHCNSLKLLQFVIDHDGVPSRMYHATWEYLADVLRYMARRGPSPVLEDIVFEYSEVSHIQDYHSRNVHLPRHAMTKLEEALLAVHAPCTGRTVQVVPPERDHDTFRSRDRSHIRRALRRLNALGMLQF